MSTEENEGAKTVVKDVSNLQPPHNPSHRLKNEKKSRKKQQQISLDQQALFLARNVWHGGELQWGGGETAAGRMQYFPA